MVHDGIGGDGSQSSELPSAVVKDISSSGPRPLRAAFASRPFSRPSLAHREARPSQAARDATRESPPPLINGRCLMLATMRIVRVRTRASTHLGPRAISYSYDEVPRRYSWRHTLTLHGHSCLHPKSSPSRPRTPRGWFHERTIHQGNHSLKGLHLKERDLKKNLSREHYTGIRAQEFMLSRTSDAELRTS